VISVPSGLSAEGVPTGVQVVGHPHGEAMAFRVAQAVETLVGFSERAPLGR
jgi:aspartyl-tRNA(Asn)/glutamyl-tRNA(Gln) amidotransferase subunit A